MKVITFVNSKAGMGATTVTVAAAALLSTKKKLKIGVLEISDGVYDSPLYCGIKDRGFSEQNLPARFDDKDKPGFQIFGDTGANINDILTQAQESLDILLIDTNIINEAFFTAADVIVIPAVLDHAMAKHAMMTAEKLRGLKYPPSMIKLMVNRNETAGMGVDDLAGVFPGLNIVGILPESTGVKKAVSSGKISDPKSVKDKFFPFLEKSIFELVDRIKPKELNQRMLEYDSFGSAGSVTAEKVMEAEAREETEEEQKLSKLKKEIYHTLFEELDIRKMESEAGEGLAKKKKIHEEIRKKIYEILDRTTDNIKSREMREKITDDLFDEVVGYGPLEQFLKDPTVTEIMVNAYNKIFVERKGKLTFTDSKFTDDETVRRVIERIVMPLGRRIDDSMPHVDARLPDGSRVNAIIRPLALDGSVVTIRKFPDKRLSIDDMIGFGSITREAADYIQDAVKNKKNIIISGGTGSGKTTLLNVLSSFIPGDERIITIEDSAELRLEQFHVVRLETRSANLEGKGAVTIRDLVVNSLRMRPDRIVVGECRGGESLDMLQAMNTGHEGSMTTLHANSPRDALSRLEVMILMAGVELPVRAIREQIRGAVNIIVQQSRMVDGSRKITQISEIKGMDGDVMLLEDVFKFEIDNKSTDSKVTGSLKRKNIK